MEVSDDESQSYDSYSSESSESMSESGEMDEFGDYGIPKSHVEADIYCCMCAGKHKEVDCTS